MFSFTKGKSLPDYGIYGIHRKFSHVNIDMTNRCHNNCVFCEYRENKIKGTMSLDDLFILLTAINDFDGYVSISMTGDPWLLEDLPERIRMIRMFWSKCHIALVSTFNIDKGHEYIDDVFDSGLDELVISCYGYDKRDYRTMHGNDGFDALCKNILHLKNVKNFHKKTVRVDLFSNVDKIIGHTEIERKRCEFLEFIRKSRIVNTFYKPLLSPRGRGQIFPSLSPRGETPPPPYPCSVVWGYRAGVLNVSWNLDVVPCCTIAPQEINFGNLRKNTVQEIFTSEAYRNFYERHWKRDIGSMPVCGTCDFFNEQMKESEAARLTVYEGQRLAGEKVYFWGSGQTYDKYKIFFAQTRPQAILFDLCGDMPDSIDGIPILHPDVVLEKREKHPIVVFSKKEFNKIIIDKIIKKYPSYGRNDIVLAVPSFGQDDFKLHKIDETLDTSHLHEFRDKTS